MTRKNLIRQEQRFDTRDMRLPAKSMGIHYSENYEFVKEVIRLYRIADDGVKQNAIQIGLN